MKTQFRPHANPHPGRLLAALLVVSLMMAAAAVSASTKQPKPKPGFPNVFTLTICEDEECATTPIGTVQAHIVGVTSSNTHAATAGEHGTNNVLIKGHNPGTTNVTFRISPTNDGNYTDVTIEVTVIKCPKKAKNAAAVKGAPAVPNNGLLTSHFTTPHGDLVVNLPADMAAGDTISGTVLGLPKGKNEAEQAKNLNELNGYVVEVENQKSHAGDRWARWSIPAGAAGVALILLNSHGKEIGREDFPVAAAMQHAPAPAAVSPNDFHMPSIGQAGKPVAIMGPFDGNLGTTHVAIGGQQCPVLAESPRQCIAATPPGVVGPAKMAVSKQGVTAESDYRNVACQLSTTRTVMHSGEQATLTLHATGLQGLKSAVPMLLVNKTPEIVHMAGGDTQSVMIQPTAVAADGSCAVDVHLTGVQPGGYVISAHVQQPQIAEGPAAPHTGSGIEFGPAPAG